MRGNTGLKGSQRVTRRRTTGIVFIPLIFLQELPMTTNCPKFAKILERVSILLNVGVSSVFDEETEDGLADGDDEMKND